MAWYQNMMAGDADRYNNWFGGVQDWANKSTGLMPEFSAKFTNPADFSRAVAEHMLLSTNASQYLTPAYRQFLLQQAPSAYALQQLIAASEYGQPAGQDFNVFFKNWLQPNLYSQGTYGFGGLPAANMKSQWGKFLDKYGGGMAGTSGLEWMQGLTPQDLQAFNELAVKSMYSPFGQKAVGNFLDEAYTGWNAFSKATPWLDFLKTLGGTGQGYF